MLVEKEESQMIDIPEDIEDGNITMPEEINFTISGIRALIQIHNHTGLDVHQAVNMCVKLFAKELNNKEVE